MADFPIISGESQPTWSPEPRTLAWFKKIADMELKQEQVDSILNDFIPPENLNEHFTPPVLPTSIWNQIKSESSSDIAKQRVVFRSHKLISSSLMPLLSVLESLDGDDPNQKLVASAIQLLCSSNLNLSRYRRSYVSKYVKPEMKQALLSQPVTHQHLFGSDFDSSAEIVTKSQSSFQRLLLPQKPKFTSTSSTSSQSFQASPKDNFNRSTDSSRASSQSRPKENDRQPFRGRGRGRSSSRGRGSGSSRSN